jgi:hypothetical protein
MVDAEAADSAVVAKKRSLLCRSISKRRGAVTVGGKEQCRINEGRNGRSGHGLCLTGAAPSSG